MLQMLQSDDDRWPEWDKEFEDEFNEPNEDWEFEKVLERDRPVKKEVTKKEATNKGISDNSIADKSKKTGTKKQDYSSKPSTAELMRYAHLGTELLAGVLVGTFLGWVFNRFTGYEGPWAMVIGVIIGAAAGLLNVYRAVVENEQEEEQKKRGSSRE